VSDRELDSPLRERKVRGRRIRRTAANAVLTTVVDTWGRPWTPRCPSRSSSLIRRTVVDSCGPGNPPEKRKADCSAAVSAAGDARRVGAAGWRSAAELCRTGSSGAAARRRARRQRRALPWEARPAHAGPRFGSARRSRWLKRTRSGAVASHSLPIVQLTVAALRASPGVANADGASATPWRRSRLPGSRRLRRIGGTSRTGVVAGPARRFGIAL
jgi:hypothetical protein